MFKAFRFVSWLSAFIQPLYTVTQAGMIKLCAVVQYKTSSVTGASKALST